jgi:hypothetical protein
MIRSITQKKPDEELERLLSGFNRIFIIGCGTCTTLTRTGGEPEVRKFKQDLSDKALNTMFIGKETAFGTFDEICTQCGTCIIGETGGICPVTNCHKGLVNGPCGGTNHGKCEIDVNKDCVWTLIYNRLNDLGRLESMRRYQKPRNHTGEPKPGKFKLDAT